MQKHLPLARYESPAVLGSFNAHDVLGAADGQVLCGGSVVCYATKQR